MGTNACYRMHLAVLGSSSAGNCTVVWNTSSSLLVDCGFPLPFIRRGLEGLGPGIPPLAGILITHLHGDHVHPLTLEHFLTNAVPVYLSRRTCRLLRRRLPALSLAGGRNLVNEAPATGIEVGTFEVSAFPVPHDAPGGCSGFSIRSGSGTARRRLVIATDLGYVEDGLLERFLDAHVIMIESNHDPCMLETSGRPAWLKRRIKEIGHLSNPQCADLVGAVMERSGRLPHTVVLAHISQECNTAELAVETMRSHLHARGFLHAAVVPTHQYRTSEVVVV